MSELQYQLCRETLKLENKVIDNNGSEAFIQRIYDDTSCLADIFAIISNYLLDIMINVGYFLAIFIISKVVFVLSLTFTFLIYRLYLKRKNSLEAVEKETGQKKEKLTGLTGELVRGIRDVKMLMKNEEYYFILDDYII